MDLILSNYLEIKNPIKEVIGYCKKKYTLINQEYIKRERMGLFVGNVPKKIKYYKEENDNLILPFGVIDCILKKFGNLFDKIETDFKDNKVLFERKDDIELRDYQLSASKVMTKNKNGILISPTGSGKTIIALDIISNLEQKALWVCNSVELLNQSKESYKKMFEVEKGDIGEIKNGKVKIGNKITFGLVQTLYKAEIDKYEFGTVVVDETHLCIKSTKSSAMFSACLEKFACRNKIGVTATLHRADGQEQLINMLLGDVQHVVTASVVADKIMKVEVQTINTNVEKSFDYLNSDGTLNFTSLQNYLGADSIRNKLIVEKIKGELDVGNSCLVLCDRIFAIEDIYNQLNSDLAVKITGAQTSKKGKLERAQAIEDMRLGKKRCLIASVKLAGTGLDIPKLNRLFFTSIQKDEGIVKQCLGRISRIEKHKTDAVCYDFVDIKIGYCSSAFRKRNTIYKSLDKCLI